MSRNYYSEINLHLIWHTKDSLPLLSTDVESLAYRYLKQRIVNTQGGLVHEIGGTETRVAPPISRSRLSIAVGSAGKSSGLPWQQEDCIGRRRKR